MKLDRLQNLNFKRALSSKELESYKRAISTAKKELNIKDTTAIFFDFSLPQKEGENTSIGSSWSDCAQDFTSFLKAMFDITSIQLEPQGKITKGNTSPYSGTNFALGEHIIDLKKLASEDFGEILPLSYIENLDKNYPYDKNQREYKTNYAYILDKQKEALYLAFKNFKTKNSAQIRKLKQEFEEFKIKNADFLEPEALFEILSKKYGTDNFEAWDKTDSNLYCENYPQNIRQEKIEQLKSQNGKEIDFQNFIQFIAYLEQKQAHKNYNSQNIALFGDCQIGFSRSEVWANKDCFIKGQYLGGPDPNCPETNFIQPWGLSALDYTKIGDFDGNNLSTLDKTGKLLYKKYCQFFKRYDGLRLDAAWQFITPFVYVQDKNSFKAVELPQMNDVILKIAKKAYFDTLNGKKSLYPDNFLLELIGISADCAREITRNIYPHLYTTSYSQYDERPEKFYQKGYKNGSFYVGATSHDNDSLVNLSRNTEMRNIQKQGFKDDFNSDLNNFKFNGENYNNQSDEQKTQENFRNAKFAEIFTTSKQFITLNDMFGMQERINVSGKVSPDNWTLRIPCNWEKFYYSQIQKGYGLNLAKALLGAINMKKINNPYLASKLEELSEILRQKGPVTTKEADILEREEKLGKTFEFLA